MKIKIRFTLIVLLSISAINAQNNLWQEQFVNDANSIKASSQQLQDSKIYSFALEVAKSQLTQAPQRSTSLNASNLILSFPNAKGQFERFAIFEASVMHPDLQANYPNIRSYSGQGLDDTSSRIRFSVSPLGFHGMILSANKEATFIQPYTEDLQSYVVYTKSERINSEDDFECHVLDRVNNKIANASSTRNADDSILRDYRLAVSATAEYTQYHGGTVPLALAAINTTMTRVNGIFENDLNVTLTLIANTDDVIYTNTASDPYSDTSGGYNGELQSTLTSVIGEANYDVGHLFANLQNNGNAGCIGCVCVNGQKGSGWTSSVIPEGESFDVDYVAHEMGHQFGGNHTWTFGGNEGTNAQMEPGSGSTIMGYAGITGPTTDVQSNSDPYFHAKSIEQITGYIKTTSCQTNTNIGNAVPVVNAGANYTIPAGTPFVLEGSATDADPGDVLTYCWEQYDENDAATTLPSATNTSGVAFRSFNPTTDTKRYVPQLETIKTGATASTWEVIPAVTRGLNFRLTVRDNRLGGGTNNSGDMLVSVDGNVGPFVVNVPNTNVSWNAGTVQTILWDVAGTTGGGVNTANVDIYLSTDGGDTYPILLVSGIPNNGSQDIIVPDNQGTTNRIMVRGSNNIFFDISNVDFTILEPIPCNTALVTGLVVSNISTTSALLNWDTVSGATYDIRYKPLTSLTFTDVTNIAALSYGLSGLLDETDYEVQVRSRCTSNVSPYSVSVLFTTLAIPPCVGSSITSFPYTETFDAGIGGWSQDAGDDGNWSLNAGGTPSGNTGPSDDITGGGNYFYTESSTVNPDDLGPNATVYLTSPCFDLSSNSNQFLSFFYHMFGDTMGSLTLEASIDNGTNWTSLFTRSGNQGNQWLSENISIDSYSGEIVKFRFVGTTGSSFTSDMAIDQFVIGDPLYCISNGNDTSDEYIGNVQLNTINNASGVGTTSTGYSDFTNISTDLSLNSDYTITITPTWTGTLFNEGYAVWIDYNVDGDFNDAGELVWSLAPSQTTPVTGNFTIPLDATLGETRMRVSLKYNGIPSSCESFDFGEVEDYTINIMYDGLIYVNGLWVPNAPSNTTESSNAIVLSGTYTVNSDINLNNLIVNIGAAIQVDNGQSLTLAGSIDNQGDITLNSNSTQYSSLIVYGSVTGDVNYKRHVNTNAGGNDLIAPPLSGQIFAGFALANPNIVSNAGNTSYLFGPFDKITESYLTYANTETATLDAGIGYRAASTDDSTFTFVGLVNTSTISVPIINSGTIYPEWNLIGNPYPSYIKLLDFLAENNTLFDLPSAGIYGYDGNGWTIWNQAYSDANINAIITPGQGFLVAAALGGGIVNFTPTMRASGSSDDFIENRDNTSTIAYLKLHMDIDSERYKTEFYVSDNASLGLDHGYDAGAFGGVAPSTSIYSQLVEDNNGRDMAIQSIHTSDLNNDVRIPLGINVAQGQQLTVNIADSTLPEGVNVYLEDSQSNTFTLLNASDFILNATTNLNGIGRFFLRFESETLSTTTNHLNSLHIYNTNTPKRLIVNGQLNEKTNLTIYDVQGRLVVSTLLETNSASQQIDITNIVTGIYIVELKNTSQTLSKKIIIK